MALTAPPSINSDMNKRSGHLWVEKPYNNGYRVVMDYMTGGDLFDLFAENKLTEKLAGLFLNQIATAIKYLHDNKIVHRDIKAENMLLEKDGSNKLTGKLKRNESTIEDSNNKTIDGTIQYMSPEMLKKR
uniref:Protein kinase domain-containing protein n=1 Tax=Ditylenchus dipsaci TaxID=166011 RepID=A0A915ET85_9BILA